MINEIYEQMITAFMERLDCSREEAMLKIKETEQRPRIQQFYKELLEIMNQDHPEEDKE